MEECTQGFQYSKCNENQTFDCTVDLKMHVPEICHQFPEINIALDGCYVKQLYLNSARWEEWSQIRS